MKNNSLKPEITCHYCGVGYPNKDDFEIVENVFRVGDHVAIVRERICTSCYQLNGGNQ